VTIPDPRLDILFAIGERSVKVARRKLGSETRGTVFERINVRETGSEIREPNYNSPFEAGLA
jgi:hypothetical protein